MPPPGQADVPGDVHIGLGAAFVHLRVPANKKKMSLIIMIIIIVIVIVMIIMTIIIIITKVMIIMMIITMMLMIISLPEGRSFQQLPVRVAVEVTQVSTGSRFLAKDT